MNEDIRKIIESVQQGNIDADEASQLIQALKPEPEINHTEGYLKKSLRIDIESDTRDDFHVKIPIKMVKTMLKVGSNLMDKIPASANYKNEVDMNLVIHAIDNEIEGTIIEMESDSGDFIVISIK
ncbi:SHOCT-like domain-containing protein [Oceanobacillus jeddahense]|uniref:YvlB/LiaX N-terminal domain-containing protein n=1 Tax=Oceanobacillus jeddahense TaxID=1462527 RepID=A0ABY5K1I2_9BACI|nr:hypothetical protein [Oceanobacillus jeddahense]UUI04629.1 hypothetical protein NP439_08240 [Oceanobacillus jeddahense]